MINSEITKKRWFMGKGQPVRLLEESDSVEIGGSKLQILQVEFENGSRDLYATIEDESKTGAILAEGFGAAPSVQIFKARNGQFVFSRTSRLDRNSLAQASPLGAEQSNSAFFVKGKYFFKLFRRLHAGIHPEQEILSQLNKNRFDAVPTLLGFLEYQKNGNSYAIGILENHLDGATNAWDLFTRELQEGSDLFAETAYQIGCATARMHAALKGLKGTPRLPEEPPFDKLIKLLKGGGKNSLIPRVEELRRLRSASQNDTNSKVFQDSRFAPQRIHGDYHLGQLLYKDGNFTVLDFEGEPTRSLDYRRRVRSPAVDIAGMLRSFAYAEAVRKGKGARQDDSSRCNDGSVHFLMGYSKESGIPIKQLEEETRPYVLDKAIYEACYELEFRPDWFWIPEKALKSL